MAVEEKIITVGSWDWFYREANPVNPPDVPTAVFLHGIPSLGYSWSAIMPELASQGVRGVAPDWLGYGRSSKPEKREFAYTPDAFVEALGAFLDALELDRVSLVVQGFLGSVGLQYALRYPDRVDRIAVLNAPVSPDATLPWTFKQMSLPFVGDMMTQDPLLVDRTLEKGSGFVIPDEDLDVYRRPWLKSSDAGRALLYTLQNLQLKSAMAEIDNGFRQWTQPSLVVWGVLDPWLSVEPAKAFANELENGQFVRLEEAAHYPQEHWSEDVGKALIPFLRRSSTT
ncbi:MAG: alpha/beta fold hydrolase [Cyanobacteria bacterium SID2]|nr:alpha/beta fold hydrolase [Cyanobacteria bacterium SID2]MBP0002489.1 alpha/beta fold hydrolase [Cyanobacteria bacterium SBC]